MERKDLRVTRESLEDNESSKKNLFNSKTALNLIEKPKNQVDAFSPISGNLKAQNIKILMKLSDRKNNKNEIFREEDILKSHKFQQINFKWFNKTIEFFKIKFTESGNEISNLSSNSLFRIQMHSKDR